MSSRAEVESSCSSPVPTEADALRGQISLVGGAAYSSSVTGWSQWTTSCSVVSLVDGDMHHQAAGCGSVPVFLVGLEEHAIAGADDLDRSAATLAQTYAFGDEHGLAQGVAVPMGAGTGHEVDEVRRDA